MNKNTKPSQDIQFTFLHIDASESLQEYASQAIEKIARNFGYTESAWHVNVSHSRHLCNVQIDVNSGWGHFQSVAKEKDYYMAVDEAVFKMEKQLQKQREKHQDHGRNHREGHRSSQRRPA